MSSSSLRRWLVPTRALAAVWAVLCIAAACGGVDSGGTGAPVQSFSSGRVSGFGSVIVNDIEFDDSRAAIVDDEGASHARTDLKLGMVVDIEAGPITQDNALGTPTAVASKVQFGPAIRGPVQAVDAASSTLTVLGQTVQIDAATVFPDSGAGLADLRVGQLLTIHALLDAGTGIYRATRIEPADGLAAYTLRGLVKHVDTAAKMFSIGNADISYADAAPGQLPFLAEGALIRVKLDTAQRDGQWILAMAAAAPAPLRDASAAALEGIVSHFSSDGSFSIAGTRVDAGGADVVFTNGSRLQLANGVRVSVEGQMDNGVLVARTVDIRQADQLNQRVRIEGSIETVDPAQASFVLRGTTVTYDVDTEFVRGSAADLVPGAQVEIMGRIAASGTRVYASKIRFSR